MARQWACNTCENGREMCIRDRVESAEFYGLYIKYILKAGNESLKVIEKNSGRPLYKKGEKVTLSFNPKDIMQY